MTEVPIYVCLLIVTPKRDIVTFFSLQNIYSLQLRFIYFCLFLVYKIHLVEVAI